MQVSLLQLQGGVWTGSRRLERNGYQRLHRKLISAFDLADAVTREALKREEAAWGVGREEEGGWGQEEWGYYAGAADDYGR